MSKVRTFSIAHNFSIFVLRKPRIIGFLRRKIKWNLSIAVSSRISVEMLVEISGRIFSREHPPRLSSSTDWRYVPVGRVQIFTEWHTQLLKFFEMLNRGSKLHQTRAIIKIKYLEISGHRKIWYFFQIFRSSQNHHPESCKWLKYT